MKQSEFTYTPKYNTGAEEFTAEIDSVKLFGNAIPSDAYTVSGDKGNRCERLFTHDYGKWYKRIYRFKVG